MSKKKLSIIISVFNEEKTIIPILKRINETNDNKTEYEVIVINDGSNDKTSNLLNSNKNLLNHLIDNKENFGKGYAIKKGLEIATGDYIIFQDGDLEYDPIDFRKFISVIGKFDADVILGSRFQYNEYTRSHNILNKLGNYIITLTFNILYNTTFTDIYCCHLCFKKDLLNVNSLQSNGFEQHAEILCKVIRRGSKFFEVPTNYNGRTTTDGKKIRFYHIFPVLIKILTERIKNN